MKVTTGHGASPQTAFNSLVLIVMQTARWRNGRLSG